MSDFEEKIKKLVMSYGIDNLLEENDIAEGYVIRLLVEEGLIDLKDYFDTDLYGDDND